MALDPAVGGTNFENKTPNLNLKERLTCKIVEISLASRRWSKPRRPACPQPACCLCAVLPWEAPSPLS